MPERSKGQTIAAEQPYFRIICPLITYCCGAAHLFGGYDDLSVGKLHLIRLVEYTVTARDLKIIIYRRSAFPSIHDILEISILPNGSPDTFVTCDDIRLNSMRANLCTKAIAAL